MMDTAKDKKTIDNPSQDSSPEPLGQGKTIYDIINSEELELLYKKNTHLLNRLSKTGKENTRLCAQLSTLSRKTSHLGDKNTVLTNKFLGLKEQISLFARQHREFNYQSKKLKEELKKAKELKIQETESKQKATLTQKDKQIHLLEKKEQVYKTQIKNLQNLSQKIKMERLEEQKARLSESEKNKQALRAEVQKLNQSLTEERKKTSKISNLKTINQSRAIKGLEKELEHRSQICQTALRESDRLKQETEKLKKVLVKQAQNQTILEKKWSSAKKKLQSLNGKKHWMAQKAEKLKKREQWLAQSIKKIKETENKIQHFEKNQQELLNCKAQILELKKQKEKLKSGFSTQLDLFIKEKATLKLKCENLKKALVVGKSGFDQAMLSFQKKYANLYKNQKDWQKQIEEKACYAQSLEQKILYIQKQKEESENQLKKEKRQYINSLQGKLKASQDREAELEGQIQLFKSQSESLVFKEKKLLQEKLKNIQWDRDKSLMRMEEQNKKGLEDLKSDYEKRIDRIEASWKKRLEHIQIEMENDLCSEKKRHEVFKSIKMREFQEIEKREAGLQEENHKLKTTKFVLEKSLEEIKRKQEHYLKNSKKWKDQMESLKSLWQEGQKQNEAKDQQIRALQNLNKALSCSLNQNKKTKHLTKDQAQSEGANSNTVSKKPEANEESPAFNHVLANIYFE